MPLLCIFAIFIPLILFFRKALNVSTSSTVLVVVVFAQLLFVIIDV